VGGEVRYYTVEEAARVLHLTPERVLEMLEDGELEGLPPSSGGESGWRVPIHGDVSVRPPPPTAMPMPAERRFADTSPATDESAQAEAEELPEEPGIPPATIEETRQPAEVPRGDDAAISPEITSESGWVSTQQAARALGISARTVRWHIERGNLDAKPEGEGVQRTWLVSVDSLHAFRDARQPAGEQPRDYRTFGEAAEIAAESPGGAIRELADRLVEEARRAEAARVRLELAEKAQSTLEAELSEERQRREEAERRRREAETERDAARQSLRELEALEQGREEATQTPPSPVPSSTPPAAREAPQTGAEPVSEESVDTAAAAAGPLRPPGAPQDPSPGVQTSPAASPGRRGLLRRFFRG
jgi:hypothetical protein